VGTDIGWKHHRCRIENMARVRRRDRQRCVVCCECGRIATDQCWICIFDVGINMEVGHRVRGGWRAYGQILKWRRTGYKDCSRARVFQDKR
jgi:hypothetical protein